MSCVIFRLGLLFDFLQYRRDFLLWRLCSHKRMGEAAVMGDGGVDLGHEGLGFSDRDYDFHHGSIPFLNFSS